jgi:hypothetical protein
MPMRWTKTAESRFRVQMTPAGDALRWLPAEGKNQLAELPTLAATAKPESLKALAVVLATGAGGGDPTPAIVYQPVGGGRVVVVEGAGLWRWAFMPPERLKQEEIYGSLWRSLVRWLAANVGLLPSQQLSLRADKLTFDADENATATLLVRQGAGTPPEIELSGGSLSQPRTVRCVPRGNAPGQYYVGLGRLGEGQYALRVKGLDEKDISGAAAFDVRGNLIERLDIAAQPDTMKQIAQESGGAVLKSADPRLVAQQFDMHLRRTRPERTSQTTAWDRWWVLLGAFAIWGAAWGLRRRSGLV